MSHKMFCAALFVGLFGATAAMAVPDVERGACCFDDVDLRGDDNGSCVILTEELCNRAGGQYLGDGTECYSVETIELLSQPDLGISDATTVSDTIEVTDSFTIEDLDVDLILTHTFLGDLEIRITSPQSTTVLLLDNTCGADDDLNVIFDDEGDDSDFCNDRNNGDNLTPPEGSLSDFDGEDAQGTWTIEITDTFSGDEGTLTQWSLHFNDLTSNCTGACCTDEPGVASDCIETSRAECEDDNGLFVGGSCDLIDDCLPLYVEFESVTVTPKRGAVDVEWTTSAEIDTVGFYVLRERETRAKSRREQIGGFVPAIGFGLQGGAYSVTDHTGRNGDLYFVVDLDLQGRETVHGPFQAAPTTRTREPGQR